MSNIPTPATINDAPEGSRATLEAVQEKLGSVPNLFRLVANSPAALKGMLEFNGALDSGALDAATQERIALAVAQVNGCKYCLAAHTYIATNIAKLSADEIAANRNGNSTDAKADVAVKFAVNIAENRGNVSKSHVEAVSAAGYSDAEIVEIITHVSYNTLTNYLNNTLDTEIDFPAVN